LAATATTEDEKKRHSKAFSGHVATHIEAIATRYIIPGETSENALMFIPAESIYAQIHCDHQDLVKIAYRKRVYIVSPSTLWATLNTITAIFRDVKMREQADIIQQEVLAMMTDVQRLDTRIASLQKNYDAMAEDFRRIRISTDKIIRRASSIDALELADDTDEHYK
jgi:DNA recombination protein RmuC|tara:strand:+ start:94 stop:594 length:501 start_codon:yes stop_codon:yes gene_type:complete